MLVAFSQALLRSHHSGAHICCQLLHVRIITWCGGELTSKLFVRLKNSTLYVSLLLTVPQVTL